MKTYKSPPIHRTPIYRARAAYANMVRRCLNRDGRSPTYDGVELRMTRAAFIAWSIPRYKRFAVQHPDCIPNIARKNDSGHYEIGNIRLVTISDNRVEQTLRSRVGVDGCKACSTCRTRKHSSEFNKNRSRPDGIASQCRICARVSQKRFKLNHASVAQMRRATLS